MESAKLPFPAIDSDTFFSVSFKRPVYSLKNTIKGSQATRETTRETTRDRILVAIKANPIATALELSKLLNLTAKGVEWNLRKLKNDGLLKRVGPDFGGHWEVIV